jgi:hypothetical protein
VIAYLDASVVLRLVLGEADRLAEWEQELPIPEPRRCASSYRRGPDVALETPAHEVDHGIVVRNRRIVQRGAGH